MKRTTLFAAIVVVFASLATMLGVSAQDDVLLESLSPSPDLCTLEPRTLEEIELLLESEEFSNLPTPTPFPDPFVMPEGYSLFEDEQIEVEKDLVRAVACFNTGEPLLVLSTYTDRHVFELVTGLGGLTDNVREGLRTVRPVTPGEYVTIISFGSSALLEDGRIAIIVFGDDLSDDDPPGPRLFFLEEVLPGRWLIDEVVEIEPEG